MPEKEINWNYRYLKIYLIYIIEMLYPVCPTCQNLLADKQIPFEEEMEKICNNKKLKEDEKQNLK